MIEVPKGKLYLGGTVDPANHERTGDPMFYDSDNFTTHGVIVGMTGSGKTGLSMILLEEALLQGVPTLIIDPKGDMGNLLLQFPDLAPGDFEPWIDPAQAERDELTVTEKAAEISELWRSGLAGWDIEPDRLGALRDAADFTIYTPGSSSGVPLNIIGSMAAPPPDIGDEALQDEIESLASSLLALVGVDSDPISGREHILLANLLHHSWAAGRDLDLAQLIGQIQDPPLRKLGVIELDSFFPADDRLELALKLNGLAASPAFASWTIGAPLDIGSLLYAGDGRPRAAVVSIAHLAEEERQFVVTLLLSKLITWMRAQPGTSELRALVYMDEVFGFVPPTAAPPSKKPILTILKQARAFGVGMVLATQNPVDLDYKAISNAGTWMVGRLQTERDKARLVDGLESASGEVDLATIDATITGLDKREFLLHSTSADAPSVFTTRWAMSYLAGPLTREQIATLTADAPERALAESTGADSTATGTPEPPALADDESTVAPEVADGVEVRYLDPAASWADEVDAVAGSTKLRAALVVRVGMLFDETKADLRHQAEWEAVLTPLVGAADADQAIAVDYDDRDLRDTAPENPTYVLPDAPIHTKTYFTAARTELKNHLYGNETIELFQNPELKVYSRVGESRDDFAARCRTLADAEVDAEVDKLRESLAKKVDRVKTAIATAEDRVREAEEKVSGRGRDEVLSAAGDLLGGLLGGRKSTRSILGGVRRASSKRRQSTDAGERVRTAENRLAEKVDQLDALEAELADSLYEIQDDWEDKAETIESTEIGLEKADITVDDVLLVWIPTD
ncbi:MAG: DUF87 domain-containing protein [Acidimicrobiia bacterium]|nr:DUF87 domain-containing protein [Acidimicrobiia bacterium]